MSRIKTWWRSLSAELRSILAGAVWQVALWGLVIYEGNEGGPAAFLLTIFNLIVGLALVVEIVRYISRRLRIGRR